MPAALPSQPERLHILRLEDGPAGEQALQAAPAAAAGEVVQEPGDGRLQGPYVAGSGAALLRVARVRAGLPLGEAGSACWDADVAFALEVAALIAGLCDTGTLRFRSRDGCFCDRSGRNELR